jgi:hypothetical protein
MLFIGLFKVATVLQIPFLSLRVVLVLLFSLPLIPVGVPEKVLFVIDYIFV